MVPAFQAAAFSQPIGVVGPPVKSPFGYHIIVVEEKQARRQVATLASSHDQIATTLKQQQEQTADPGRSCKSLRTKAKIVVFDDRFA